MVQTVADLSDLAAQTDAFVRAHRPLTGREGPNTRSTASSPTIPSQTNRPSSYSSVVSSAARTSSPDQMPSTMSGTAKPSVTTVSSFGVDTGHRSSGAGPATGMCPALLACALAACGVGQYSVALKSFKNSFVGYGETGVVYKLYLTIVQKLYLNLWFCELCEHFGENQLVLS